MADYPHSPGLVAPLLPQMHYIPTEVPVGTVLAFAGNILTSPPSSSPASYLDQMGWTICDGRQLEISKYPELFAALCFLYAKKGDKSGTFRLPDYRGQFLRGAWDSDNDIDDKSTSDRKKAALEDRVNAQGSKNKDIGSIQDFAVQKHEHIYKAVPVTETPNKGPLVAAKPMPPGSNKVLTEGGPTSNKDSPPGDVKVSQFETRPYNVLVNYIIKFTYMNPCAYGPGLYGPFEIIPQEKNEQRRK
jgi:hypothetical protein